MSRILAGLIVLLVLIGCALQIHAQQAGYEVFPATVRFTGALTGPDGKPLRGVVGINFYLYNDKESGTPLWMETQNVHIDKDGRYSVMLGSATALGLPAEVFVGGEARWLGVQVSGEAERPRTLLFSLPYGGLPSLTAIQPSHETAMTNPQAQQLPPTVHGNGVANFVPLWTGTNVIGDSVIAQSASNVGIGTTTPGTILDVFSSTQGIHAPMAQFGSSGVNDANSILTSTGSGITEMFQSGCVNCFVPGVQVGDGGLRVNPGTNIFFGDRYAPRLKIDTNGNDSQPRTAGGMVKAMLLFTGTDSRIWKCFNSTLDGWHATQPPCGFSVDKTGVGDYIFDFGFQVDDRFFSLTQAPSGDEDQSVVCTDFFGNLCTHTLTSHLVDVTTKHDGTFTDSDFYLVVY